MLNPAGRTIRELFTAHIKIKIKETRGSINILNVCESRNIECINSMHPRFIPHFMHLLSLILLKNKNYRQRNLKHIIL